MLHNSFRQLVSETHFLKMKTNKGLLEIVRNGNSTKIIQELLSNDGYPDIGKKSPFCTKTQ